MYTYIFLVYNAALSEFQSDRWGNWHERPPTEIRRSTKTDLHIFSYIITRPRQRRKELRYLKWKGHGLQNNDIPTAGINPKDANGFVLRLGSLLVRPRGLVGDIVYPASSYLD